MSFIRSSMLTMLGTMGRVFLSALSQIIISRVLGPTGKGIYAFLVQIPTVLVPISSLGLNYANTYYVAREEQNRKSAVGNSTTAAIALGILAGGALGLSYLFLRHSYLSTISGLELALIVSVLPFGLANLYWLSVYWGMDQIGKYNLGLLIQFVGLAAGVGILAAFKRLTVVTGLEAWVLANVLQTLYLLPGMLKLAGRRIISFDLSFLRHSIGYGLKSYAANVIVIINYRLDVFIITGFLPMRELGWYTTAVTLAEMATYVGHAVNTALLPKLASGKDEINFSSTPKVCRLTLLLALIAALGTGLLAYPMIVLFFGRSFLPSMAPLLILLPGIVALGGSVVLSGDLMARGKPIYNTISTLLSVVLTVALDFSLIPLWGIKGAALASSIVYTSLFLFNFFFYRRESGKGFLDVSLLTRGDLQDIMQFAKNLWRKRRLIWG